MEEYHLYLSTPVTSEDLLIKELEKIGNQFNIKVHNGMERQKTLYLENSDLFFGLYPKMEVSSRRLSELEEELRTAMDTITPGNLLIFHQHGTNYFDEQFMPTIGDAIETIAYNSREDLLLQTTDLLKEWKINNSVHTTKTSNLRQSCYIFTRSPDRPGILRALFDVVKSHNGNILNFRQDVEYRSDIVLGNIHLFASWDVERPDFFLDGRLKEHIESRFQQLYNHKQDHLIEVIVEGRQYTRNLKTLARFEIYFFDKPGIAERIFKIFSDRNISVLESNYRPISQRGHDGYELGRVILFADITEANGPLDPIIEGIKKIGDVFNIEMTKESGVFSY